MRLCDSFLSLDGREDYYKICRYFEKISLNKRKIRILNLFKTLQIFQSVWESLSDSWLWAVIKIQ